MFNQKKQQRPIAWSFVLLPLLALALLVSSAGDAQAYPHFQFSSDTNACSVCHYAPAGGGLLNGWGREESADTLSRGGDGDFLHGLLEMPDWLTIGGDFRSAGLLKDSGSPAGASLLFFPMQADLNTRISKGALSLVAVVGLRGQARSVTLPQRTLRDTAGSASRVVSREHYLQYRGEGSKYVSRIGRFYAPYGLRLPDHTSYIRRYGGFNILNETYNLSVSRLGDKTETHISAHVSDVLRGSSAPTFGLTLMHERRTDTRALGAGLRVTKGPSDLRALAGFHYKKWLPGNDLLLMAELDGGYQRFDNVTGSGRLQLIGYMGPVWFPTTGVSASLGYELFDEDVLVKGVARHAITSWVSLLPRAHFEVLLLGRGEKIGSNDRLLTAMLQLHYYL